MVGQEFTCESLRTSLSFLDVAVIVFYFSVIIGVAVWATLSMVRWMQKNPDGGVEEYFLAAQGVTWLPIAGSIFATNVGATMFIGLSGTGAAEGFAPIMYEWGMVFILPILAYIFLPVYRASASYTMPQYLAKRYGGKRIRLLYTMVLLVCLVLLNVAGEMYAAGLVIQLILGWNIYYSVIPLLLFSMIYTVSGGLLAVIYTEVIQTVVLLIGGAMLFFISINKVSFQEIWEKFSTAASSNSDGTCGYPPKDSFHIFRPVDSEYPWTGLVFGLLILGTFYFCNNQIIVQRTLAAKSIIHGKAACVCTMYLKIFPFFIFLIPGMIGRILYSNTIGCASKEECFACCKNPNGCSNIVYPLMMTKLLPIGMKGLVLAALLAANMSSLSSIFNSASTMVSIDIWKRIRPRASDRELVIIGKLSVVVMTVTGLGWLPMLQEVQGSQFWDYMMKINSYTTPPLLAIFVVGLFWAGATEAGAFTGMVSGLLMSLVRMVIHFSYVTPSCGEPDTRPRLLTSIHYLHFAILSFTITCLVTIIVSLFTQPRHPSKLHRVLWRTRHDVTFPDWSEDEDESTSKRDKRDRKPLVLYMDGDSEEPEHHPSEGKGEYSDDSSGSDYNEENPSETDVLETQQISGTNRNLCKDVFKAIMGFPDRKGKKKDAAEKKRTLLSSTTLEEPVFWSRVCAVAAVICITGISIAIGTLA